VGKDQKQHVEVARDIAIKFNNQYGQVFTVPEPSIRETVAVVPGLDGQKMSKSYNNTVDLFGEEKETRARIMRVVTDSKQLADPKDPAACNVYALYSLFASDVQREEMARKLRAGGYGYGDAKKELFSALWTCFEPFRNRRKELEKDPGYVQSVLRTSAERARSEARKTLNAARRAMGLD